MAVVVVKSNEIPVFLLGKHFGAARNDYVFHGAKMHRSEPLPWSRPLACIGYGSVFLMCGIFLKNPMIPVAVVWVREKSESFLADRPEKGSASSST